MLSNYLLMIKEYYNIRETIARNFDCMYGCIRVFKCFEDEREYSKLNDREEEIENEMSNLEIDIYDIDVETNNPINELLYEYNEQKCEIIQEYINCNYNECFEEIKVKAYIIDAMSIIFLHAYSKKWLSIFEKLKPLRESKKICSDIMGEVIEYLIY